MKKASTEKSFLKPIAFIFFAVVGFVLFNIIANGIFAVKERFHKETPAEQTIETPAETP